MFQFNGEVIIKYVVWCAIDPINEGNDLFQESGGLLDGLLLKRIKICLSNDAVIQGLRNANKSSFKGLQVQAIPLRQLRFLQELPDPPSNSCRAYRDVIREGYRWRMYLI